MIELLYGLSVGILGIFLGTQIAEGALFVPYWKSMKPSEFFNLHKTYGSRLYKFFAPITILATFIPITAAVYATYSNASGQLASLVAGVMAFSFFITFPIYFKKANQSFADASLSEEELPKELTRWGNWHWARVCMELVAFVSSIVALMQL